jgi:hypothetical protein
MGEEIDGGSGDGGGGDDKPGKSSLEMRSELLTRLLEDVAGGAL